MAPVLTVAMAALLLLVGCGGEDEGGQTQASPPPPSQTDTPPPEPARPLPDAWYEDPDGDNFPTAVEEAIDRDPSVDECAADACRGVKSLDAVTRDTNVLLMLDSSGSMAGPAGGGLTKLQAAKRSIYGFTVTTPKSVDLGFLVYGHKGSNRTQDKPESCRGVDLLQSVGEVDYSSFRGVLRRFEPRGYTPIAASLERARSAFKGREGDANRVVLVSDGVETCGGDPVRAARELNSAGIAVTVDVVGLDIGKTADRERLQRIAKAGGGEYTDVSTGRDLEAYFRGQSSERLRAASCLVNRFTEITLCKNTAVTDARFATRELPEQFSEEEQVEEARRIVEETGENVDASANELKAQVDETKRRLLQDRQEIERRLRGVQGSLPGGYRHFASTLAASYCPVPAAFALLRASTTVTAAG